MPKLDCGCSNLNDREVTKRIILGATSLTVALATAGFSRTQPPARRTFWIPAVPFFIGYLGLMQAQTRTCVALALTDREMRNGKVAPIESRRKGWKLKKRSLKILFAAAALALASSAICKKKKKK